MRLLLIAAVLTALLVTPAQAQASLPTELAEATARASALGLELEQAASRDGGLRVELERLEDRRDRAQARLDARVRSVWTTRRLDPFGGLGARLSAAGLRRITTQGAAAAVRVDRQLVDAVAERSRATQELRRQSADLRAGLAQRATAAIEAQERARVLLARLEAQIARETQIAREAQDARALAEQRRAAATARSMLDRASATVTAALTPAQTRRSLSAQAREAPLVALIETAGAGYPAGYAPTGQVLAGLASWYGPGFVGNPTASGSPYDPERLTCAHKTLRLGTVVRVSANGRAVSCLVNDRGPYVGPRILDLSRAGSRALGFDGVQQVVVEVLLAE